MKKIGLGALVCVMLTVMLAGCQENDYVSSAADASEAVSSEVEVSSEASSELETPSEAVQSSEPPSEAPVEDEDIESSENSGFGVPSDDDNTDDDNYVSVPGTTVGSADFQAEFDKNEIDAVYNEDMQYAASPSKVQEIIMIAMAGWENAVSTAYDEALNSIPDSDTASALRAEQEQWVAGLEEELKSLRNTASDGLTGEYQVMLYYRARTAELLNIVYENTGTFNLPDGQARGVG